jgi:hypothetical protein
MKLIKDTSQGPNVDLGSILESHKHLRSPVWSRLDITRQLLARKAGVSKIYKFNGRLSKGLEHYVLWLKIAVDDIDAWKG